MGLSWVLAGCTIISTLIAATSLFAMRTKMGIDHATLDKMKREQTDENRRADERRRNEEARRERDRLDADERRNKVLRDELDQLTRRSNARFEQWQEAVADLDDLWTAVEDELLPWIREAYRKLVEAGIDIKRPPSVHRRRPNVSPRV